jgi:hypothetical protein
MAAKSALTHEFRRGTADGNGSCLFASISYVNDFAHQTNSQRLRSVVADRIHKNKDLHPLVLESNAECKTIEDYCTRLKADNVYGGEIELQVAAIVCYLVIHVVSMKKTVYGNSIINIVNYGKDTKLSKECAYILYDEDNQRYNPLYVVNKHNSIEILTIFPRHDRVVLELLKKFIQKEFGGMK